ISIDTRRVSVAEKALKAGADMVNDISALQDDPGLARFVAERQVPVVLMHKRGSPKDMQNNPYYEDTVLEIKSELSESIKAALKAGIDPHRIIIDPGIGFGKRLEDNLIILKYLKKFKELGFRLLVGLSRKSFLGKILADRPVEGRLSGSLAANAWALLAGADIIRTHDVAETVDLVKVIRAIQSA
ncbi:MAG: dihydropteroate synthase, partial [Spirochaetota bacterium]